MPPIFETQPVSHRSYSFITRARIGNTSDGFLGLKHDGDTYGRATGVKIGDAAFNGRRIARGGGKETHAVTALARVRRTYGTDAKSKSPEGRRARLAFLFLSRRRPIMATITARRFARSWLTRFGRFWRARVWRERGDRPGAHENVRATSKPITLLGAGYKPVTVRRENDGRRRLRDATKNNDL